MAKVRLTLYIERRLIQKAKRVAQLRRTSVSAMVSEWVESLDDEEFVARLSPGVRELVGLGGKMPEGRTYRDLLDEAHIDKYGNS